MGGFIFSEIEMRKVNNKKYVQNVVPRFYPYYEIRNEYLLLQGRGVVDNNEFEVERVIDLSSPKEIYYMIINRKIDNFRFIGKILKRDKGGLYGFEDFIRGRMGEIYADMFISSLLKMYPALFNKDVNNYFVSNVEEYKTNRFTLRKRDNGFKHSNYYLYYNDDNSPMYENLRGEFDFAYLVNAEYNNNKERIVVLGESKTGYLKIKESTLRKNIKRILSSNDSHLLYTLIVCDDYMNNPLPIYKIYEKSFERLKKEKSNLYYKVHFIPAYFTYEDRNVRKVFHNMGKKIAQQILELFDRESIHAFSEIGRYNNYNKSPHEDKAKLMREIPIDQLIKDAKTLPREEFEKRYGSKIYIDIIG